MANQTARDTLEYLYFNVTTDSNKLRDIIPTATTTFYRNMRILRAGGTLKRRIGSGRPCILTADQRRSLEMIALRNSMWSTDKVNDHFTERQNVRVSHGTVYNVNIYMGSSRYYFFGYSSKFNGLDLCLFRAMY